MSDTYTLTHVDKPWTMNYARNTANKWRQASLTAEWRGVFHLLAVEAGVPHLERVTIVVDHETATRRKVDPVAIAPAYKAALDGIVDAGVLDDDGPDQVTLVSFIAPHCTGRDALTLTIKDAA